MVLDFSYQDVVNQCNTLAYLNVASFCLLSGCGTVEMPQETELTEIYRLLQSRAKDKMPGNIFFMSSLYKRSLPVYKKVPESSYDFTGFQWANKKVKAEITPIVMSYSICCLNALARKLLDGELTLDNKEFIAFCMTANAARQAEFMQQHLKMGDLYYSGEDVGENNYGEYHIEIHPANPNLLAQFLAVEAFSSLDSLNRIESHRNLYNPEVLGREWKFGDELAILPVICGNVMDNINVINSRDLSVIGLSLISTYQNIKDVAEHKFYSDLAYSTANAVGFELTERIYQNGDVCRSINDAESSSFVTLCNCLSCFLKLYEQNGIDKYYESALKIYDRMDSFWNEGLGLFVATSTGKMRYSIKDIGYIIGSLRTLRNVLKDSDLLSYVERQLAAFYRSAIVNSKIFNLQLFPILQQNKMELHKFGASTKNTAPTFAKAFEVKVSKKKYYCEADIFQPEYVLCACKMLL